MMKANNNARLLTFMHKSITDSPPPRQSDVAPWVLRARVSRGAEPTAFPKTDISQCKTDIS
jgi:hypothetical protein